jgi:hypothetical protein
MTRTERPPVPAATASLPALLEMATDALRECRLEAVEILRADPVRRTVTARVIRRGTHSPLIAKWIAPDAPPRARGAFDNELRFYTDRARDPLTPETIEIAPGLLVLADAGGGSLRAFLADALQRPDAERAPEVREQLRAAFAVIARWTADALDAAGTDAAADDGAFERRLTATRSALATGGRDVGTPAAAVGAALERATRPGFLAAVAPIVRGVPRLASVGRAHGALDTSNVLLSRDGRVLLLDFAAWSPSGSVVLDPVAALASATVATSSRPGLRALVRDAAARALADEAATAPLETAIVSLARALEPIGRQNTGVNPGADSRGVLRERLALLRSAVPRNRGR